MVSLPVGGRALVGTVLVDRDVVTWSGKTPPLVPVVVEIKVNGQVMADDTKLDGEPRGALAFAGTGSFKVGLGETGPVRLERLVFQGRYELFVESHTDHGGTFWRGYEQDVLPNGPFSLGAVNVGVDSNFQPKGQDLVRLNFDLPVRDIRVSVEGTDRIATTASPHVLVRLDSHNTGSPSLWADYPAGAESVPVRVYRGCYSVDVVPSTTEHHPAGFVIAGSTPVGQLCTCDRSGGTPDAASGG